MSEIEKTIHFRPHHFLCMLTYIGKGYSPAFTENFDRIIESINQGNIRIEIVSGPDDICAPRLCDPADLTCHCHDTKITETDNLALIDLKKIVEFQNIEIGSQIIITEKMIAKLREFYQKKTVRTACKECEWYNLCTDIAEKKFEGTKLK